MVKVTTIAKEFFGNNIEKFLTEMAGNGFKVEGWSASTELPLHSEDFRVRLFVVLKSVGVSEARYASALTTWNVIQTVAEKDQQANNVNGICGGEIQKIEDAVVDAIAVQEAGLQQLAEVQLEEEIVQERNTATTTAIVLELANLDARLETRIQIRDVLSHVTKSTHENQRKKGLSLANKLLKKIQGSYSSTVEKNRQSQNQQKTTQEATESIFSRIAGITNTEYQQSEEGK